MSGSVEVGSADPIDRDVRRFVDAINAAYAEHAGRSVEGLTARREVAELVRASWRSGGPEMAETREFAPSGVRLRLYRPAASGVLPVMLYIHGGGWTLFSIDTHDRLMREYAARAGIAVIGIDYSLSPEHKFPVALHQIAEALDWIAGNAAQLGVDPERIFVGGDSAGANLAVAACLLRREQGLPMPAGMALNYGAFAPEATESYRHFDGPLYSLEAAEMDEFWANYVERAEDLAHPLVAPLLAELHGLPPAFLAIAECDILADGNRAMAERLAEAGVAVKAVVYPGTTHSFLEAVSIAPVAAKALDDQAAWIGGIAGT